MTETKDTGQTQQGTVSAGTGLNGLTCCDLLCDSVIAGDCIEVMSEWPDNSVDVVITDPPYGVTQNEWDEVPDLSGWWHQINRICRGAIIATAQQPFTTDLITANRKRFKWADVWRKSQARGHLNAKVMPLRQHEDILVFGGGRITFNPQWTKKKPEDIRPLSKRTKGSSNYGEHGLEQTREMPIDMACPRSVVEFDNCQEWEHPTQKPESLMSYLVATFTNPGDIVLDPFAGSGTTLKAAKELNRRYIGIEINPEYVEICNNRTAQEVLPLFTA